jgi:hypothetical protein
VTPDKRRPPTCPACSRKGHALQHCRSPAALRARQTLGLADTEPLSQLPPSPTGGATS